MGGNHIHTDPVQAIDFKRVYVSIPSFGEGEMIPPKYTCDGQNISPPIDIQNIPRNTTCLAIIVDDPDAPVGTWSHWVVWNIPVTHHIGENKMHGIEGLNDFDVHIYRGPCPPGGTHRYYFKVYALDSLMELPVNSRKNDLEKAMCGHILGFGQYMGRYKKR